MPTDGAGRPVAFPPPTRRRMLPGGQATPVARPAGPVPKGDAFSCQRLSRDRSLPIRVGLAESCIARVAPLLALVPEGWRVVKQLQMVRGIWVSGRTLPSPGTRTVREYPHWQSLVASLGAPARAIQRATVLVR